jgi:hypothetical protein
MKIRNMLQAAAEKITGRRCDTCKHNKGVLCVCPDYDKSKRCREGVFPVGYEKKEG